MAHIGLTPQSVNALGGYRVQGRGDEAAHRLIQDAKAMQQAGAFAVVLEVVPSDLAAQVTKALHIPTIGIGAGPGTDAQVLVWQDMAGLSARQAGQVRQAVRRRRIGAARRRQPLRRRGAGRHVSGSRARVPLTFSLAGRGSSLERLSRVRAHHRCGWQVQGAAGHQRCR